MNGKRVLALSPPGTVTFSTMPDLLSKDEMYDLPNESILIQAGGNGRVFMCKVGSLEVAVKKTAYRSEEYVILTKLKHTNVLRLLGFMWGKENLMKKETYFCYHYMPLMTGMAQTFSILYWRYLISN